MGRRRGWVQVGTRAARREQRSAEEAAESNAIYSCSSPEDFDAQVRLASHVLHARVELGPLQLTRVSRERWPSTQHGCGSPRGRRAGAGAPRAADRALPLPSRTLCIRQAMHIYKGAQRARTLYMKTPHTLQRTVIGSIMRTCEGRGREGRGGSEERRSSRCGGGEQREPGQAAAALHQPPSLPRLSSAHPQPATAVQPTSAHHR